MPKMNTPKGKGKFNVEKCGNKGTNYKRSKDTMPGAMGKGVPGKNPKVKAYGAQADAKG